MSIEADLRTYLLAQTPLTNIIGDRIAFARLPQSTTQPSITFHNIGRPHGHTLNGAAGFAEARFQFDCWASVDTAVVALAEALRNELQGYRGTMGGSSIGNIVLLNDSDLPPEREEGSDNVVYHRASEYFVWFREAVPSL